MRTSPRAIMGPWKAGFTLDEHTVSSEFLGYNEQGHAQYETVRSEIGELLYQLKYQSDSSPVEHLSQVAADFISRKRLPVDIVVPLPPSKQRRVQPVALIAESVARRLDIAYDSKALRKVRETPELKSMTELNDRKAALAGAFSAVGERLEGKSVLLLDDLYRSGASMEEAARAIRASGAKSVYALALTRTRTNR